MATQVLPNSITRRSPGLISSVVATVTNSAMLLFIPVFDFLPFGESLSSDNQGFEREEGAFHAIDGERNADHLKDVVFGHLRYFVEGFPQDFIAEHRGGGLTDGAAFTVPGDLGNALVFIQTQREMETISTKGIVFFVVNVRRVEDA